MINVYNELILNIYSKMNVYSELTYMYGEPTDVYNEEKFIVNAVVYLVITCDRSTKLVVASTSR